MEVCVTEILKKYFDVNIVRVGLGIEWNKPKGKATVYVEAEVSIQQVNSKIV